MTDDELRAWARTYIEPLGVSDNDSDALLGFLVLEQARKSDRDNVLGSLGRATDAYVDDGPLALVRVVHDQEVRS